MSILISVVIPVFNRPEQLVRAVQSALTQSYPVHEVIVVDDASTEAVIGDRLPNDERVKIIRLTKNVGAATARSIGVRQATGKFVAFLDSDDFWLREKLAAQVGILERVRTNSALFAVVCGWQAESRQKRGRQLRIPISGDEIIDFASGCWFCPGSTLLISKQAFDIVGNFAGGMRRLEDFEWFLRFALAGGKLLVAPIVGAYVTLGRHARTRDVREAADHILAQFLPSLHPAITFALRRRLRAWLHLEKAAAARNEGGLVMMAYHLTLSLIWVPRRTIQLRRWWTTLDAHSLSQTPAEPRIVS